MTRSTHPCRRPGNGRRVLAALAATATVGALVPAISLASASSAAATSSCLAPTGLSPDNGPTGTAPEIKDVTVSWVAPSDAPLGTSYEVEFSPNQDYTTNLTYDSPATNTTTLALPVLALPHGSYFWRVRVVGRSCWSDDHGSSAEVTTGWRVRPTLTFPSAGATVAAVDERFSWQPINEASSYLLEVASTSGTSAGYCVTQGTTVSAYDVPSGSKTDTDRVTANPACDLPVLANGNYIWRVVPLDDTKTAENVKPYSGVYGADPLPAAGTVSAHDSATLSTLNEAEVGAPSEDSTFTIGGTAATSSTLTVNASLVTSTGQLGAPCDVSAGGTAECSTTPTLHWTPVTGASSYRVLLSTDQHFTNIVRAYDTNADNLTPIDQLLDSQAGQAYFVEVCSDNDVCTPVDSDSPQTGEGTPASAVPSFRKRTPAVTGLSSTSSNGSGTTYSSSNGYAQVTLSWADQLDGQSNRSEAAEYEVQTAPTCDFSAPTTTTTDFTSLTGLLGAGTYFWRVRDVDASGSPGPWTVGNRDTPVCSTGAAEFTVSSSPPAPGTGPAVTVDATDKSIIKSGKWVTRKASGASKGTALVTDGKKKQSLTYSFARTSVMIGYCTGPMDGQLSVYVDGKLRRNINSYKKFTSCKATFLVAGLSQGGKHKLVIQSRDKVGFTHGTAQVVVDYIKIA